MKIIVSGGGSGGHITPLLAVAAELKRQQPDATVVYIGQRSDRVGSSVGENPAIDGSYSIWAGKLRRYHGQGWRQLLDVKTMFFNIRDIFYTCMGIVQSLWIISRERPDVVFIKGGFVCVPVGLAAAFWRVPYVTHDSDAIAGLANRIIARWAAMHAVGLPEKMYSYPLVKTKTVGVPISSEYKFINEYKYREYKRTIGIPVDSQVVFVTGGGLGARELNHATINAAPKLLSEFPKLYIVHLTGYKTFQSVLNQYDHTLSQLARERVVVKDFVHDLYKYSGAADVIVTRAGATSIAEFAMQGKACIIVPNPLLAGGHQLRNADAYQAAGAALVVEDAETNTLLAPGIASLLKDQTTRKLLGEKLHGYANPYAARDLAKLVLTHAHHATAQEKK